MEDTQKENYEKFMEFADYAPASMIADKLKVSEKTISRYKNKNTDIPEHIILIIDLYKERNDDKKTIDNLKFELSGIKQTIHDYKLSQQKLFEV
jgi:hypothetical protein